MLPTSHKALQGKALLAYEKGDSTGYTLYLKQAEVAAATISKKARMMFYYQRRQAYQVLQANVLAQAAFQQALTEVPAFKPAELALSQLAKATPIADSNPLCATNSEQWIASLGDTIPALKGLKLGSAIASSTGLKVTSSLTDNVVSLSSLMTTWHIPQSDLQVGIKIGHGGFSIVYTVTWHFNTVALKRLLVDELSEAEQKAFAKEAQFMTQLHHPQLIQFFGYTLQPYGLVMEYLPKGDLAKVLHNPAEVLSWDIRTNIALDIAKGLSFLHSKDILHRDLKSMNVLLDKDYRAKLTDFGLAQVKAQSSAQSQSHKLVVTFAWTAPEILDDEDGKPPYSPYSDSYSYGMVVWEISSRRLPFQGLPPTAVFKRIIQGKQETIPEQTPPKLAQLIKFCWAPTPQKRPRAIEIIEHLTDIKLLGPGAL